MVYELHKAERHEMKWDRGVIRAIIALLKRSFFCENDEKLSLDSTKAMTTIAFVKQEICVCVC